MTANPQPLPPGTGRRRRGAWLFVAALAVRLAVVAANPAGTPVTPDKRDRYDRIAASLLAGEGFALGGTPTAVSPPAYPLLIAAVHAVAGPSQTATRVTLAILDAAACVAFFVLAWRLFGAAAAAVTGVALAACPYLVYLVVTAGSDTLFLAFLAGSLLLLTGATASGRKVEHLAAGVALGLATLTRATSLLLPLALAAAVVIASRNRRRALAAGAALLLGFALTLTPWTVRNAAHFQRFVPVQTLGGMHLLLGATTREQSEAWDRARRAGAVSRHWSTDDASLYRSALARIAAEPGTYLRESARRLLTMWYRSHSHRLDPFLAPVNFALLLLAGVGAWLARARWRELLPLAAVVAYFVAVHATMAVIFRYMMPVVPILVLFASLPASRLLARRRT